MELRRRRRPKSLRRHRTTRFREAEACQDERVSNSTDSTPRVPRFAVATVTEPPEMNRLQRSFYQRYYRPGFEAGTVMEAGGEIGYAVMMLHELLASWESDPARAMSDIERLGRAYPRTSVASAAWRLIADMHYLRGEWAEALGFTYGFRRLDAFIGLGPVLHPRLSARDAWTWAGSHVTPAGYKIFDAVLDELQTALDSFHDEHGVSALEWLWGTLHADEPTHELAVDIAVHAEPGYDVERIAESIARGHAAKPATMTAFAKFDGFERPIPAPWAWPNPYAFEGLIRAFLRKLIRDAENRAREGAGLPRVGEGLVGEMALLNALRAAFPNERIDHQLRPGWLAPQSLDFVFAGRNVAVERQGEQHLRPVAFFGGQEAYERQLQRDATKRMLCKRHGMHLIEVFPDSDLAEVVAEIQAALGAQQSPVRQGIP